MCTKTFPFPSFLPSGDYLTNSMLSENQINRYLISQRKVTTLSCYQCKSTPPSMFCQGTPQGEGVHNDGDMSCNTIYCHERPSVFSTLGTRMSRMSSRVCIPSCHIFVSPFHSCCFFFFEGNQTKLALWKEQRSTSLIVFTISSSADVWKLCPSFLRSSCRYRVTSRPAR